MGTNSNWNSLIDFNNSEWEFTIYYACLSGEKPLVECSFITEFEDHIFVTVDAEAFFFLHDLITSYIKEKEKVVKYKCNIGFCTWNSNWLYRCDAIFFFIRHCRPLELELTVQTFKSARQTFQLPRALLQPQVHRSTTRRRRSSLILLKCSWKTGDRTGVKRGI